MLLVSVISKRYSMSHCLRRFQREPLRGPRSSVGRPSIGDDYIYSHSDHVVQLQDPYLVNISACVYHHQKLYCYIVIKPCCTLTVTVKNSTSAHKLCKHGSSKKRWRQTMLTLSGLGFHERWTDYAHFVRVGGSMSGGQTMLTLSELGVRQR